MSETIQRLTAECECIHADASGNIKSIERENIPVVVRKSGDGEILSITEV